MKQNNEDRMLDTLEAELRVGGYATMQASGIANTIMNILPRPHKMNLLQQLAAIAGSINRLIDKENDIVDNFVPAKKTLQEYIEDEFLKMEYPEKNARSLAAEVMMLRPEMSIQDVADAIYNALTRSTGLRNKPVANMGIEDIPDDPWPTFTEYGLSDDLLDLKAFADGHNLGPNGHMHVVDDTGSNMHYDIKVQHYFQHLILKYGPKASHIEPKEAKLESLSGTMRMYKLGILDRIKVSNTLGSTLHRSIQCDKYLDRLICESEEQPEQIVTNEKRKADVEDGGVIYSTQG